MIAIVLGYFIRVLERVLVFHVSLSCLLNERINERINE